MPLCNSTLFPLTRSFPRRVPGLFFSPFRTAFFHTIAVFILNLLAYMVHVTVTFSVGIRLNQTPQTNYKKKVSTKASLIRLYLDYVLDDWETPHTLTNSSNLRGSKLKTSNSHMCVTLHYLTPVEFQTKSSWLEYKEMQDTYRTECSDWGWPTQSHPPPPGGGSGSEPALCHVIGPRACLSAIQTTAHHTCSLIRENSEWWEQTLCFPCSTCNIMHWRFVSFMHVQLKMCDN